MDQKSCERIHKTYYILANIGLILQLRETGRITQKQNLDKKDTKTIKTTVPPTYTQAHSQHEYEKQ